MVNNDNHIRDEIYFLVKNKIQTGEVHASLSDPGADNHKKPRHSISFRFEHIIA